MKKVMRPQTSLFGHSKCEFELRLVTSYQRHKNCAHFLVMASIGKACKRRGGQYSVAGRPNRISCTNGQCTEENPFMTFHTRKRTKFYTSRRSDLCEHIGLIGAAPIRLFFAPTISMIAPLQITVKFR